MKAEMVKSLMEIEEEADKCSMYSCIRGEFAASYKYKVLQTAARIAREHMTEVKERPIYRV